MSTTIYVFTSDQSGRHARGAALVAMREHGAMYGQGEGLQGRSYAIPTKDRLQNQLPLNAVAASLAEFMLFARKHRRTRFDIDALARGLAGSALTQLAPMFASAPDNVRIPPEIAALLLKENEHA